MKNESNLKNKKLILITGLLRSGTTWVGKIIASEKGIKYLNEPFNPDRGRKDFPLGAYFYYIDEHHSIVEQESVKGYINHMIHSPTFYFTDQIRLYKKYNILTLKNIGKLFHLKHIHGRPLMKDPMAILSAEWIYKTFHADVVIVLRNPVAFVASLKTAGWSIPFSDLLAQELMLTEHFKEYVPLIRQYSIHQPDIIDQGILIWNIVYSRIRTYFENYKNTWYFVKHEDLSKNPLHEFSRLFRFLDIDCSEKLKSIIVKSTDGSSINRLSRESIQNLETWKTRLTPGEISRIKTGTHLLYSFFYDSQD